MAGALFDVDHKAAEISPDGMYRYRLLRTWDDTLPSLTWVMLNPSTADASVDDPTIRRCVGYAKREGFGGIKVVNLFAYRATRPQDMLAAPDPIGDRNDAALTLTLRASSFSQLPVIVAWGANAPTWRVEQFREMAARPRPLPTFLCLGVTKAGQPRHPLMVRADQPFETWGA